MRSVRDSPHNITATVPRLTGPSCLDPFASCSFPGETKADGAIDEVSRSLGDVLEGPTRGCGPRWSCVIDVPRPRRFRTQAIGRNDRGWIPRITGLPVDCHRHCCGPTSILRVDGVYSHGVARGYAPGLMRAAWVASLGSTPPLTVRNTPRSDTVRTDASKEPHKIVQEGHAANCR